MTEKQLQEILRIGTIETLQLIKGDHLIAALNEKIDLIEYLDVELKITTEILKRLKENK